MQLLPSDGAAERPAFATSGAAIEAIYAVGHWLLARERVADAAKVFRVMLRASPRDERGWLGLGECHERVTQLRVAAELYGAGSIVAGRRNAKSVRCLLACARILAKLGYDIDAILDEAERSACHQESEDLTALVLQERQRVP